MAESIDWSQLAKLITVNQVAEIHGVLPRVVRKAARAGEIPGTHSVLGKFGFDPEAVLGWEPPEGGGERAGRKAAREDGRRRYRIYLDEGEVTALRGRGFEIVDPRVAARERRQARKAGLSDVGEKADEASSPDPFADFTA